MVGSGHRNCDDSAAVQRTSVHCGAISKNLSTSGNLIGSKTRVTCESVKIVDKPNVYLVESQTPISHETTGKTKTRNAGNGNLKEILSGSKKCRL